MDSSLIFSPPPYSPHHRSSPFPIVIAVILFVIILSSIALYYLLRLRRLRHRLPANPTSISTTTANPTPLPPPPPPPPPTSITEPSLQSAIDSLPTFPFSSVSTTTATADCSVCLEEFTNTDLIRALPRCLHAFHADCLDRWFSSNFNCPLCRSAILPSDSELSSILRSASSHSFRFQIGNLSRRRGEGGAAVVAGGIQRSYSVASSSLEYEVMDAEVPFSAISSRNASFRIVEMEAPPPEFGEHVHNWYYWIFPEV